LNGSGKRAVGVAGAVWRRRGSGGSFYRRSGREGDGGDGEHRRARHDGGNGANADCDGSRRRGVRGRLKHSGGVVAEAGRGDEARGRSTADAPVRDGRGG
jgi:hypothetical protein